MPSVTEREVARAVALKERAAFLKGARWADRTHEALRSGALRWATTPDSAAEITYPLPRVTRAREMVMPDGMRYRVVDGVIQVNGHRRYRSDGGWTVSSRTAEQVRALADLLANPLETVEDDGNVTS